MCQPLSYQYTKYHIIPPESKDWPNSVNSQQKGRNQRKSHSNKLFKEIMKDDMEDTDETDYEFALVEKHYTLQKTTQVSSLRELAQIYLEIYEAIISDRVTIPVYNLCAQYSSLTLKASAS